MLRLFRVERCADGAPWALWMCDVVGRGWRVCERRAWFAGMVVVCVYVCVAFRGLYNWSDMGGIIYQELLGG